MLIKACYIVIRNETEFNNKNNDNRGDYEQNL